jgi:hypothetical protein
MIRENPTNFGVWDSVLDPANAKVRVEKAYKRRSEQQVLIKNDSILKDLSETLKVFTSQKIDDEIRKKELGELSTHDGSSNQESDDDKDPEREVVLPYRNFASTGKYLHENDLKWCKKNTKFSEKEIIKWFKRFRTMCPRGDMTLDHV